MNPDPPVPEELQHQIQELDGMSDEQIAARLSAMRDTFKMFGTSVEEFSKGMKAVVGEVAAVGDRVRQFSERKDSNPYEISGHGPAGLGQAYNAPTDGGSAALSDGERAKRRQARKRQRQARKKNR